MHRAFAPLKKWLPGWIASPLRRTATAVLTPMIDIATNYLSDDGIIICDDAELHAMDDAFTSGSLSRVDFYGFAPGVVLPRVTSIFFRPGSSFFGSQQPVGGDQSRVQDDL